MRPLPSVTLFVSSSRGALLAVTILLLAPVAARGAVSMSVSPIRVDLNISAGQTRTDAVTVENRSDEPLRLRVSIADWHLSEDGTPVFVKRGKEPAFSMSEWVEVNPTELELAPLGTASLRYTVTAPGDAPAGGYRTALLIETVPEMLPRPQGAIAYLNARVGVILYNHIGTVAPEIDITAQEVVPDPERQEGLAVRVRVRNAGRTQTRVSGNTRIVDASGRDVELADIADAVVLPQSERYLFVRLTQPVPTAEFSIVSRLDVGLPELLEAETRVAAPSRR